MAFSFKNKFLVPVGSDNERYFELLEKYKRYIGGVYIGWPDTPSGRHIKTASRVFFNRVFRWCQKNKKVFDILFNMQANAYYEGFNCRKVNLSSYRSKLTELTFASVMLSKEKVFSGFKKNVSVNYKVNFVQQLHALKEEIPSLNSIIIDRDINRDQKKINAISKVAGKLGISTDILVVEGCVPFCPNKIDHNIFVTSEHFYPQSKEIMQKRSRATCRKFYEDSMSNILRCPFLTREVLGSYRCRFFKISGRESPMDIVDQTMAYYALGEPQDIGVIFPVVKRLTYMTTDMIPKAFHKKILSCKNECYRCAFCSKVYKEMEKKRRRKYGSGNIKEVVLSKY